MVKPSKPKPPAAEETARIALEYLKKMNRPYNATDVFNNLKNAVSKTVLNTALGDLAAKGLIQSKVYGKVLIYCAKQVQINDLDSVIAGVEKETVQLEENIAKITELVKAKKKQLLALSGPSNADLLKKLYENVSALSSLSSRLEDMSIGRDLISPDDLKKVQDSHEAAQISCNQRKKISETIFRAISDSSEMKINELKELLGYEDGLQIKEP